MKRRPTWLPLNFGEFQSTIEHLGHEALGAYMLLYLYAGKHGGEIPTDEHHLRKLTDTTRAQWARMQKDVLAMFCYAGERCIHPWIAAELDRAAALIDVKSRAGAKANEIRWQSYSEKCDTVLKTVNVQFSDPVVSDINELSIPVGSELDPHLDLEEERKKESESFGLLAIDEPKPDLLGEVGKPKPKVTRLKKDAIPASEIDQGFTEFWEAYPRKDGKHYARVEYGKAIKSGATPAELLTAVREYPFSHDQFDKHAKNWLKGRVWLDEKKSHQGVASIAKVVHKPTRRDWATAVLAPEPDAEWRTIDSICTEIQ